MENDMDLFLEMLNIDSTSSEERRFSEFLKGRLPDGRCRTESFEVGDGTENLLFSWGRPGVFFCTHLDTVPPYFAPHLSGDIMTGRGSCDAKGQIYSMYRACLRLADEGYDGFGLLLLSGEETGSHGARSFSRTHPGGKYVIVGEPTDNCMVSASKGTKSYGVTIRGKSAHSGYPRYGISAVELFVDFVNRLRNTDFPSDPELGDTVYNIGCLESPGPQNVLSDRVSFRLYFRTTFASDALVQEIMDGFRNSFTEITAFGGDSPSKYLTLPGFAVKTVAFGSDAPQLSRFENKILCGPGSILVAHTPSEHVSMEEIDKAVDNYVRMFKMLKNRES